MKAIQLKLVFMFKSDSRHFSKTGYVGLVCRASHSTAKPALLGPGARMLDRSIRLVSYVVWVKQHLSRLV